MPNAIWDQPSATKRRVTARPKRLCSIDGCGRAHLARGWCQIHYERWSRNGDPLIGSDVAPSTTEGVTEKPCTGCGGPKPVGRGRALCDVCKTTRREDRRARDAEQSRRRELQVKYGITLEDYQDLLDRQGGGCAICTGPPTKGFRCFDVDHDHETGVVRGLLCRRCNTALGYIESGFHLRALAYLEVATCPT